MSLLESTASASANNIDPLLNELLEHRAKFLAFLTARVSDPAAAEDILQTAYTRTLEKGGQIKKAQSVVAWFYQILRNALTDHIGGMRLVGEPTKNSPPRLLRATRWKPNPIYVLASRASCRSSNLSIATHWSRSTWVANR